MNTENYTSILTNLNSISNFTKSLDKITFSWYDYIFFSIMLSLSVLIGIYFGCFGSKQSTTNEYLMGGKKMRIFPISMSLIASHVSGITLLAVPADVFRFGAAYWVICFGMIIIGILTIFVFLPVFFKLQITSTYEYLERRFDNKTRMFASFLYSLSTFLYLPIVIYIPALAFSAATGINVHFITPIVCGICIFYTTLGGLKAVVWTDTLQFSATVFAVIAIFILGTKSAGGIGTVWENAGKGQRLNIFDFDPDPTKRDSFWIVIIGFSAGILSQTAIHQSCVQKYLSLSTIREANLSVIYFSTGLCIITSFSVFSGLIMYSKYANCDPFTTGEVKSNDQLLPYFVMDVGAAIPGLPGIFIAGVFCAALSTLSASLNCLAGTIYEDFICKWIGSTSNDRTSSNILKITVIVIGVTCTALVFIVEHLGGILQLAISLASLPGGALVGIFTLGLLFPKISSKGAFYGAIIGLFFTTWVLLMARYYASIGLIRHEPKPTSTDGCDLFHNSSVLTTEANFIHPFISNNSESIFKTTQEPIETPSPPSKPFFLFRISYYYYTILGTFITMISASIISYATKNDDPPVHKDLLSPVVYFMLSNDDKKEQEKSCSYNSINKALHTITTNADNEKN